MSDSFRKVLHKCGHIWYAFRPTREQLVDIRREARVSPCPYCDPNSAVSKFEWHKAGETRL